MSQRVIFGRGLPSTGGCRPVFARYGWRSLTAAAIVFALSDFSVGGECRVPMTVGQPRGNPPPTAELTLVHSSGMRSPDDCVQPGSGTNETLVVTIRMTAATETVVAGQFFLEYDSVLLDFLDASAGEPPFTREIYLDVDEGGGTIDYAIGIEDGGVGTAADHVLAVLRFHALREECAGTSLVSFRGHFPPTRLGGEFDVPVTAVLTDLSALALDGTPPVNGGLNLTTILDPGCDSGTITFSSLITDNCALSTSDVLTDISIDQGSVTLDPPTIVLTQVNATTVSVSGSVSFHDIIDCTAILRFTVDSMDFCGNEAPAAVELAEIGDIEAPLLTVPSDITTVLPTGVCEHTFNTLTQATATDSCTANVSISFTRSDGKPNLLDPYEQPDSPILVTWQAEDDCGNTSTAVQTISIESHLIVDIELSPNLSDLSPFPGDVLTRCIRFELWECPGDTHPSGTVGQEISFPVDVGVPHRAVGVVVLAPCGVYTCVTARDPLHTLRSTSGDFTDEGTHYSASFIGNRTTGGHWLIGGNLNGDRYVDILDFGAFVVNFQRFYGTGDTTCSTPALHADITGDGLVFTGDFTYIQINILKNHELNCCGRAELADSDTVGRRGVESTGPVLSISVADLWRLGIGELGAADIDGNGVLDLHDMAVFAEATGATQFDSQPNGKSQAPSGRAASRG